MDASISGIIVALGLNLIDLVTGFLGAVKTKSVQSGMLRNGLFKKCGFLFTYLLAFIVDTYGSAIGLELTVNILPVVLLYVALTEITSIIENITVINPDISKTKLLEFFDITNSDEEESE